MSDTLYERYNTGHDNYDYIYGAKWRAQTFTVGNTGANENHNITSVKLLLYRVESPGTVTVGIRAVDDDGKPTGSDLTSGTTNGNTLPTGSPYEWREITLTSYTLQASTKYAIVFRVPNGDSSNSCVWRRDASSPTYTGGSKCYSLNSGSTWTTDTFNDFMFEEYGTTGGSQKTHTSFLTYLLINNTLLTINSGQIASSYGMETTSPNSIVWKFSKIQNSSNVYYPMYKDRKWRWISGNSEL